MGLLERHGEVRTKVVLDNKSRTLQVEVRENIEPGSEIHTDALRSYRELDLEYVHNVIDHAERYADGHVHTNGLENFWSLLKRFLKDTYVSVEPYHLYRYLDGQAFRFNEREGQDADRFKKALGSVAGRRLTYRELMGKIEVNRVTTRQVGAVDHDVKSASHVLWWLRTRGRFVYSSHDH